MRALAKLLSWKKFLTQPKNARLEKNLKIKHVLLLGLCLALPSLKALPIFFREKLFIFFAI